MKSAKKILALILAGVMALAMLTGCGKSTSLDRTMAEGLAECFKSSLVEQGNHNNISVSYQVPELRRDIAPLFDENWITKNGLNGTRDTLNSEYTINGKDIRETLTNILSPYKSAPLVSFIAADVTDVKNPVIETSNLIKSQIGLFINNSGSVVVASITSLKIAVTHKTVKGRTYVLAVIIEE